MRFEIFRELSQRSVVSWNAMISGFAVNGCLQDLLDMFSSMISEHVEPDSVTILNVIQACGHLGSLRHVEWIHGYVVERSIPLDVATSTAFIDMYCKHGYLKAAKRIFLEMPLRNVVSWSAMISGHIANGDCNQALLLFKSMIFEGVKPEAITLVSLLQAFSGPDALQQGQSVHSFILKTGLSKDLCLQNSLLGMYTKHGLIEYSLSLFKDMRAKDIVSWSSLIAGLVQSCLYVEALRLLSQMQAEGVKPNAVTLTSILPACADFGALNHGKCIHGYVIRHGFGSDLFLATGLIAMYSRTGNLHVARCIFDNVAERRRDVALWSSMIAAYGMHGCAEDALFMFSGMQNSGVKPNGITFLSVLYACSHAGMVDEASMYFDLMKNRYGIIPRMEHYICMVDLLGRAGHFKEALDFIKGMPIMPNSTIWSTLLHSCQNFLKFRHDNYSGPCVSKNENGMIIHSMLFPNIYTNSGVGDLDIQTKSWLTSRNF